jgi:hypothetical protein
MSPTGLYLDYTQSIITYDTIYTGTCIIRTVHIYIIDRCFLRVCICVYMKKRDNITIRE